MQYNNKTAYQKAYEFLFSYIDFSLSHQEQVAPERFELERMFNLLAALGDPQKEYPAIHIAGTKGKGSVAALCASSLRAAGYRTGLYTSPHLHDFRERMQVDGTPIPEEEFVHQMEKIKSVVADIPGVTSYELQTALAFLHFASSQVDCAVVEVGMGGRLDSTNILTPVVSVITNISYDHTFILGDTLSEIAGEKGGIIKPGVPVVIAPQHPEALDTLEKISAERKAPRTLVGEDLHYTPVSHAVSGQRIRLWTAASNQPPLELEVGLLGPHQIENAATAFAALKVAETTGLPVPDDAIREGFKQVRWPGRFEIFPGSPTVIFDGAHNRHSAQMLYQTMSIYFPEKPYVLVFGASEDKDIAGMFEELLPGAKALVLVHANHPRAAKLEDLRKLTQNLTLPQLAVTDQDDLKQELVSLAGHDGIVLVTGSLYLVGQLRQFWLQNNG